MPHDPETEDTDMMRIIGRWFGFDWEWMKHFTPYAQVILIFTYLRTSGINMKSSAISVKNTSQTSKKHKNSCNIQLDRQDSPNFSLVHKAKFS